MPECFSSYHVDDECETCMWSKTVLTIDADIWHICFLNHDKSKEIDCSKYDLKLKGE